MSACFDMRLYLLNRVAFDSPKMVVQSISLMELTAEVYMLHINASVDFEMLFISLMALVISGCTVGTWWIFTRGSTLSK